MKYKINNYNKINDKIIRDDVFRNEMSNYEIRERKEYINCLIDWIAEPIKDKELMKEDLKYLMSFNNEYILSSILTNEYIRENTKEGQKILAEIMDL